MSDVWWRKDIRLHLFLKYPFAPYIWNGWGSLFIFKGKLFLSILHSLLGGWIDLCCLECCSIVYAMNNLVIKKFLRFYIRMLWRVSKPVLVPGLMLLWRETRGRWYMTYQHVQRLKFLCNYFIRLYWSILFSILSFIVIFC